MISLYINQRLYKFILAGIVAVGSITLAILLLLSFNIDLHWTVAIVLPILLMIFLFAGLRTIITFFILRKSKTDYIPIENVSSWKTPTPEAAHEISEALDDADFSLIGLLGFSKQEDKKPTWWIYSDKQGYTQAQVDIKGGVQLISLFEDGFILRTLLTINQGLTKLPKKEQVHRAYKEHQISINTTSEEHGSPIITDHMDSLISWEQDHRYETILMELKKSQRLFMTMALFFGSLLLMLSVGHYEAIYDVDTKLSDPLFYAFAISLVLFAIVLSNYHGKPKSNDINNNAQIEKRS